MNMIVFFEEQLTIKKHLHKIILNINVKLGILRVQREEKEPILAFLR